MTIEELIKIFDDVTIQARRYHWQTESYAEHEALGAFYGTWNDLADKFVETYAGVYGRPKGGGDARAIAYKPDDMGPWLLSIVALVDSQSVRSIAPDTALQNILDEISGAARQTAYLLTMKR